MHRLEVGLNGLVTRGGGASAAGAPPVGPADATAPAEVGTPAGATSSTFSVAG